MICNQQKFLNHYSSMSQAQDLLRQLRPLCQIHLLPYQSSYPNISLIDRSDDVKQDPDYEQDQEDMENLNRMTMTMTRSKSKKIQKSFKNNKLAVNMKNIFSKSFKKNLSLLKNQEDKTQRSIKKSTSVRSAKTLSEGSKLKSKKDTLNGEGASKKESYKNFNSKIFNFTINEIVKDVQNAEDGKNSQSQKELIEASLQKLKIQLRYIFPELASKIALQFKKNIEQVKDLEILGMMKQYKKFNSHFINSLLEIPIYSEKIELLHDKIDVQKFLQDDAKEQNQVPYSNCFTAAIGWYDILGIIVGFMEKRCVQSTISILEIAIKFYNGRIAYLEQYQKNHESNKFKRFKKYKISVYQISAQILTCQTKRQMLEDNQRKLNYFLKRQELNFDKHIRKFKSKNFRSSQRILSELKRKKQVFEQFRKELLSIKTSQLLKAKDYKTQLSQDKFLFHKIKTLRVKKFQFSNSTQTLREFFSGIIPEMRIFGQIFFLWSVKNGGKINRDRALQNQGKINRKNRKEIQYKYLLIDSTEQTNSQGTKEKSLPKVGMKIDEEDEHTIKLPRKKFKQDAVSNSNLQAIKRETRNWKNNEKSDIRKGNQNQTSIS